MLLNFADGLCRADISQYPGLLMVRALGIETPSMRIGAYLMYPVRREDESIDITGMSPPNGPRLDPGVMRPASIDHRLVREPEMTAAIITWELRLDSFLSRDEGGQLDDLDLNFVTLRGAVWRDQAESWQEVEIELTFLCTSNSWTVEVRSAYLQEVDGTRVRGDALASGAFPVEYSMLWGLTSTVNRPEDEL